MTVRYSAADVAAAMKIDFLDDQLAAIEAPATPGVIAAGAGSGKTAVMAARVVYLVANGMAMPNEILGLTFTRLATAELRQRIRQALASFERPQPVSESDADSVDSAEPTISTYDSFGQNIIKRFGIRIGVEPDAQVMTDVRRQQIAARTIYETSLALEDEEMKFGSLLENLLKLDDALANLDVTTNQLREFDQELVDALRPIENGGNTRKVLKAAEKRLVLTQLVDEFRQRKQDLDAVDYADMSRLTLRILRECPDAVQELATEHKFVLLDEYQDTSTAQRLIMQLMFAGGHSLTAVGDGLQSIYSFRGANPMNIDGFPQHFAHAELPPVFSLPITLRNGKTITGLANVLTENLRTPEVHATARPLVSVENPKHGHGRIRAAYFEQGEQEFAWYAEKLEEAHAAGIPFEEMALLFRKNEHVGWFYRELTARGIPCQIRSKHGLFEIPEIAELIAYLRVIAEPTANTSWVRILGGQRWRLSQRDIRIIGRVAQHLILGQQRQKPTNLAESLDQAVSGVDTSEVVAYGDAIEYIAEHGDDRLSPEALERLRTLNAEIEELRRHTSDSPVEFAYRVLDITGLWIESASHVDRLKLGMQSNLRSFLSLLADFSSVDGSATLFDVIRWLDDSVRYDSTAQLEAPMHKGAVQLMTVHASKGLQFRVVGLPRLADDVFPSSKGQPRWATNAHAVPDALRRDVTNPILKEFPDRSRIISGKSMDDFAEEYRKLDALDEDRLIYVAVTRSQDLLLASSSYFFPGDTSKRAPSRYLEAIKTYIEQGDGDAEVDVWMDPDADADVTARPVVGVWPHRPSGDAFDHTAALAQTVLAHIESPQPLVTVTDDLVTDWDAAIAALEIAAAQPRERVEGVALPVNLSVTAIQRLNRDPEAFVLDLVRPMPQASAVAATRGTTFHAWVERYGRTAAGLGVDAALPGMEDVDEGFELQLASDTMQQYIATFEKSEWAQRIPHAVEFAFSIPIGATQVKGCIDAIYRDGDRWLIVDWKTNAKATADDLQLSIYRIAWARKQEIDPALIDCAFYYVALDETVRPERLLTEAEVEEILAGPADF